MSPNVCAVVVTYNRRDLLRECLQALVAQSLSLSGIIVVNNASTDGTSEMVQREFPQVDILNLPDNVGGAGGFHAGMKRAYQLKFDWVWVMDDDSIAELDALAQLLCPNGHPLHEAAAANALASTVVHPNGHVCYLHRRRFDPWLLREPYVEAECYTERCVDIDTASFVGMLISKRAIEQVGLPLAEFFIYYDDTEYSLRIRSAGGRILLVPNSRIVHKGEIQAVKVTRDAAYTWKHYYGIRNMIQTYRRYGRSKLIYYGQVAYMLLRGQARILVYRKDKMASSKLLWRGTMDGLLDRTGKTVSP